MPSARHTDAVLTQPGRLRLYSLDELMRMPPPEFLVDQFIPESSFSVIYGPSGVGKSFIAFDLLASLGAGIPWQGQKTKKCSCLYVSAEGRGGLGQRVKAWMSNAGLDPIDSDLVVLPEAISMHDDEQLNVLFDRFEELDAPPDIVVIDTLARCFEGDENSTEDMTRFVRGVDRIRHSFGSSVVAVHHTNAAGTRERGNGALKAATDMMLLVEPVFEVDTEDFTRPARTMIVQTTKQKDAPAGPIGMGTLMPVKGTKSCVIPLDWMSDDALAQMCFIDKLGHRMLKR